MSDGLWERYRQLAARGEIADDPAQALAVEKLQLLANRLVSYTPPRKTDIFSFFTRRHGEVPKGLYIFGGVGRGKTMLMNLFYETIRIEEKRRLHFHEFMAEVHGRIAKARTSNAAKNGDAVAQVGADIAAGTKLLCLDELFVIDIADATILNRLFAGFLAANMVIVTTSNVPPGELYKDGRNRDLFLPFIALVEDNMEVLELTAARDYRQAPGSEMSLYFTPADSIARGRMDSLWQTLTRGEDIAPLTLMVAGHALHVPMAGGGLARFRFADLFAAALGAGDYLELARRFHTIFIDGVPIMDRDRRNEARRFITFIDTLYDNGIGLVLSADAEPDNLYRAGDGADHFERTASRLTEMRRPEYFEARPVHRRPTSLAAEASNT
jgi:cell division protein ZapE